MQHTQLVLRGFFRAKLSATVQVVPQQSKEVPTRPQSPHEVQVPVRATDYSRVPVAAIVAPSGATVAPPRSALTQTCRQSLEAISPDDLAAKTAELEITLQAIPDSPLFKEVRQEIKEKL